MIPPTNDNLGLDDEDDDAEFPQLCHECGGDGYVFGDELDDGTEWYDHDEVYVCPCCLGSGLAKDCTYS